MYISDLDGLGLWWVFVGPDDSLEQNISTLGGSQIEIGNELQLAEVARANESRRTIQGVAVNQHDILIVGLEIAASLLKEVVPKSSSRRKLGPPYMAINRCKRYISVC